MSQSVIRRYFSENIFNNIKYDFKFLIDKIIQSGFEYDLQIRDNYFNLYYKGNSIGRISYSTKDKLYEIKIHDKFINDKIKEKFSSKKGTYLVFLLPKEQLPHLFSATNLFSMAQKVKKVNYQEEIIFEQMLMTDNVNRTDLIIIDRQIIDKTVKTKIDLLTLVNKENNNYQFCVVEVKLGNSPELKGNVIQQLKGYIDRISNNFEDYKKCYEINFKQKQELGLFAQGLNINIVPNVLGLIAVLGYSGIAHKSIIELREKDPEIKILHLKNFIDLSKIF